MTCNALFLLKSISSKEEKPENLLKIANIKHQFNMYIFHKSINELNEKINDYDSWARHLVREMESLKLYKNRLSHSYYKSIPANPDSCGADKLKYFWFCLFGRKEEVYIKDMPKELEQDTTRLKLAFDEIINEINIKQKSISKEISSRINDNNINQEIIKYCKYSLNHEKVKFGPSDPDPGPAQTFCQRYCGW
ncbi:MAG: hypothetical protein ACWA5P_12755 [bacterium]